MKVNKWKIAFWVWFVLSIPVVLFSLFMVIDHAVTLDHLKKGYADTEEDYEVLLKAINKKKTMTEQSVREVLPAYDDLHAVNEKKDTIYLNRTELFFKDGILVKIEQSW